MSTQADDAARSNRAHVPADIDAPDRIAFGLTFRQLAIVGTAALLGWLVYSAAGDLLPAAVWLVAAVPVAAVTVVVALGRRDGLPLDAWLRHGLTFTRTPRVHTPGTGSPAYAAVTGDPPVPAVLRAAVTAIGSDGTVTTAGRDRALIACATTNIHLRTSSEQTALLDGFGRFLNALTGPAQIVSAAYRLDLRPHADAAITAARLLPHPALRDAAAGYAAFIADLDASVEPLRRQVLTVVTGDPDTAARALGGLGITTRVLDGPAATAALAAAADPYDPPVPGPRAVPGTPITLRSTR
ncbi:hypothetical protein F4553_008046 [Allocatelliglobosispora scoriae]|uniref:PrgI family protein n=1 Tax=Allocatelliglobosispora scoriae TaxID=643052 RepID=A0A841C6A2_9ACTN|nr:PrgI family protein [Allocatelliglobosispora scoriae]MBB5874612.1 hypothetical protein [Allocatelliglobosispora scoriae]